MVLIRKIKLISPVLLLIFLGLFNPYQPSATAKELKVGFIYLSSTKDAGWSYSHDLGRQLIERLPGVTTNFVESISDGENTYIETVLRHMAQNNYDLIFATSYGYLDAILKIAPQFPNVVFMHCAGNTSATKNIGTYYGRMYEARYLTGLVAGGMTRSNIVGYVAAHPLHEVVRGINAFALGVWESNPDAKILVRWTKDWNDPLKEKQAANELIDAKADVIAQHQDSPAIQILAEKRGVFSIGHNHDMSSFAPDTHLTASIWNWGKVYANVVQRVSDKSWKSEEIWWGLKEGLVDMAPFGAMVPEKLRATVLRKKKDIISKNFSIFTGPLFDQEGNIRISKGKQATDAELQNMDWFLKGVVGPTNAKN
jgi:basic membrane protein A and related proteins